MKTLGKIIGLLALGLLILLVALGFALTQIFNPNDYKDEIQTLARDKAGIELTINGDIGWSLFPWLGLELQDTQIRSTLDPEQNLAHIGKLGLSVRVLPLLRKEIQMSDVHLDDLQLNLVRDKQGRNNWDGIGQAHPVTKTPAQSESMPSSSASTPAPEVQADSSKMAMLLDIDSLNIGNAQIAYRDEQNNSAFKLEGIYLETGAIAQNQDIPVKLSAFYGSNQPLLRARLELTGLLHYDLEGLRYQFKDAQLGGEASGDPFANKTLNFSASGQLLFEQKSQQLSWQSLVINANQLRALGELQITQLDSQPQLQGQLSVASFNLRDFLLGLGQQLPEMADSSSLSKLQLASKLSGNSNSLAFEDLQLSLDDSQVQGRIAISDLSKSALQLNLNIDQLNLDRYLPASSKNASNSRQAEVDSTLQQASTTGSSNLPNNPSSSAWSQAALLPLETLRALQFAAELRIGQLQITQEKVSNLHFKARSSAQQIQLEQLRGDIYQGQASLSGKLDLRQETPEVSINAELKNLQIAQLVKQKDQPTAVSGLLDLTSQLRSTGNTEQALIDHLNGQAQFILRDGVLVDANLEQQLCMAIATLNRKSLSSEPRGRDTPFKTLSGSLNIRNGVASNNDLQAKIPGLSVTGKGTLDLRVLGLDYHLGLIIEGDTREMPDAACAVNPRYAGLEWPLRCRGPIELGAKACRLDQDGVGRLAARMAGDKLNEKIEEKLGDKVSPELRDALKNLFNR